MPETAGTISDMKNLGPACAPEKICVLLIDDQPIIGEAVRRLLAADTDISYNYCSDPEQCSAFILKARPTVILQDLVMPQMDGLELLKLLRSNPQTEQIPVIVLSTKEDPEIKKHAFELGANDYMVKLPDRIELVARIRYHSRAYRDHLERESAMEALARALLDKNEFMRIAGHDLKGPLSNILGASTFLEKHHNDPETDLTGFLQLITRQAEHMRRLIEDYVDAQAIEDGELQLDVQIHNLNEIAQNCARDLLTYCNSKETDIRVDLNPTLPNCRYDPVRIAQVVGNLTGNAVKFSPLGSHVIIRTRTADVIPPGEAGVPSGDFSTPAPANGPFVIFEVQDNGPGLSKDDIGKLFGRYARLSALPTGGEKSTGLGLSISRRLVQAHGGRIGAHNNSNRGATFWFALPCGGQ